jgi:hypothetical protein
MEVGWMWSEVDTGHWEESDFVLVNDVATNFYCDNLVVKEAPRPQSSMDPLGYI